MEGEIGYEEEPIGFEEESMGTEEEIGGLEEMAGEGIEGSGLEPEALPDRQELSSPQMNGERYANGYMEKSSVNEFMEVKDAVQQIQEGESIRVQEDSPEPQQLYRALDRWEDMISSAERDGTLSVDAGNYYRTHVEERRSLLDVLASKFVGRFSEENLKAYEELSVQIQHGVFPGLGKLVEFGGD